MDIIWKKPDGSIAVTTLFGEIEDRAEYAATLKERGEIPPTWVLVHLEYPGPYPLGDFDSLTWDAQKQQVVVKPAP